MGETQQWAYHATDHFRAGRAAFLQSRKRRKDVARLHLGCGNKILRGYVNIDSHGQPDIRADITNLKGLVKPSSVEEILAIHVFEHIFVFKAEETLKYWYSLLKPGGKLILEMPDLVKVIGFFKLENPPPSHTMLALYGGEMTGRVEDVHKWCWTYKTIEPILKSVGFSKVEEKPAMYHVPERDFRVEAVK